MPQHEDWPFGSLVLIVYLLLGADQSVGTQNLSNQENFTKATIEPDTEGSSSRNLIYGPCTTTCGIGIREVMLSNGCPGTEAKCLVRVEECRGQIDCGWGKPLIETPETVQLTCIYTAPDNRFIFSWTMLVKDRRPRLLPNDSNILEVKRQPHPVVYQCDTLQGNQIVARIKYVVYTEAEIETKNRTSGVDIVMVFVLITTIVVFLVLIIGLLFLFLQCKRSTKDLFKSSTELRKKCVPLTKLSCRRPLMCSRGRTAARSSIARSDMCNSETCHSDMSSSEFLHSLSSSSKQPSPQ